MFARRWKDLHAGLDDDERIITIDLFEKFRDNFDSVRQKIYIFIDENGANWVKDGDGERLMDNPNVRCIHEGYIVRLRLPWNTSKEEFLVTPEEFEHIWKTHTVVHMYVMGVRSDNGLPVRITPGEYFLNRGSFKLMEVQYLVRPKTKREILLGRLGVNGDKYTIRHSL